MKTPGDAAHVSSPQRIIRNTVFSTFSELSILFTSVFFLLATRFLGDTGFGRFSIALAFVGLFSLLIVFGFSYSITKVIVRRRREAGAFVSNALTLQAGLTLVCLALCMAAAFLLKQKYDPALRRLMLIVFAAEALKSYTLTLRSAAKAMGGFHYDTIAMNAERIFLLAVGGGLLIAGRGVFTAAWILAASRLISFFVLFFAVRELSPDGFLRPSRPLCRMLLSESWIYVVQSALWRVYDYIDVVILSLMIGSGFQPVAWYNAGKKFLEGLWILPNILTEALYPEIASRHLVSKELVRKLFDRSLKYLLIVGFAVSLGTVLMSKTVVDWLLGPAYRNTSTVLLIFGIAVVPSYLCYLFGNTLIAVNLQKREIAVSAARSAFNVISNVILISRYGYLGAAAATLATNLFAVGLYAAVLHRAGLRVTSHLALAGKSIAALVLLAPVYGLVSGLHAVLQCAVLMPLFGLILFWFRVFEREEIEVFARGALEKIRRIAGRSRNVGS